MRYRVLFATLVAGLLSAEVVTAYYLDTPHNESNGIYCDTCHGMPEFTVVKKAEWTARTAANPDDTLPNAVCLKCHSGAPVVAPLISAHQGPTKMVHSSTTTHSATPFGPPTAPNVMTSIFRASWTGPGPRCSWLPGLLMKSPVMLLPILLAHPATTTPPSASIPPLSRKPVGVMFPPGGSRAAGWMGAGPGMAVAVWFWYTV